MQFIKLWMQNLYLWSWLIVVSTGGLGGELYFGILTMPGQMEFWWSTVLSAALIWLIPYMVLMFGFESVSSCFLLRLFLGVYFLFMAKPLVAAFQQMAPLVSFLYRTYILSVIFFIFFGSLASKPGLVNPWIASACERIAKVLVVLFLVIAAVVFPYADPVPALRGSVLLAVVSAVILKSRLIRRRWVVPVVAWLAYPGATVAILSPRFEYMAEGVFGPSVGDGVFDGGLATAHALRRVVAFVVVWSLLIAELGRRDGHGEQGPVARRPDGDEGSGTPSPSGANVAGA
jgi:hypothetical protein